MTTGRRGGYGEGGDPHAEGTELHCPDLVCRLEREPTVVLAEVTGLAGADWLVEIEAIAALG